MFMGSGPPGLAERAFCHEGVLGGEILKKGPLTPPLITLRCGLPASHGWAGYTGSVRL